MLRGFLVLATSVRGAKKKVLMWKERLGNALNSIELVLVNSEPFGTQAIKAMHFYLVVIKKTYSSAVAYCVI